jgi:hypothetical protein
MMRLLAQYESRTVIIALDAQATMADLMEKCTRKFDLSVAFSLCLNVTGFPVIEDVDEVVDGDRIFVRLASNGESTAASDEGEARPTKEELSEDSMNTSDASSEEDVSEDSKEDEDYEPTTKRARTATKSASPITMEAVMDERVVAPVTESSVDDVIRERIRNILQRGLHPTTPEAEAANSMRLAERMLRKYNLSRAEIVVGDDVSVDGDMFDVHIRHPQTKKPSTTKQWFQDLACAIKRHFKCKCFMKIRKGKKCLFSFYGISSNAYAAALGFEVAFNRIMTLVSRHTVPNGEYDLKRRTGEISVCRATYTKLARVSYCDGIAMGLLKRVRDTTTSSVPEENEYATTTEEETRLACYSKRVEQSVLETNNVKISKKRPRTYTHVPRRVESYAAGKRDSSDIELDRRTLA